MPRKKHKKKSPLSKEKSDDYEPKTLVGIIRMHPKGFGFVTNDQLPHDVFIPKHLTDNAVDGDTVEISLKLDYNQEKGPEGRILSVVRRGRTHLAGIISHIEGAILAHVPLLGPNRSVVVQSPKQQKLSIGDRVLIKVHEWGDTKNPTICSFVKILGNIQDPSCDIIAAMEEYDLEKSFSQPALKDAKLFGTEVKKTDIKDRVDLTHLECFTIDPQTSKDFDDALSISQDSKGHFHLGVHIADVAHYVSINSPLDKEAQKRCNSTYFPGYCLPMLPEELSNRLCSLEEKVLRLTATVSMEFDKKGALIHSQIFRSYIKSKKRFTYEEAKKVLDKKKKSPHFKSLKLMVKLCQLLKKDRFQRGSIDFALPELVLLVDEKGEPVETRIEEYDITHQLVEEFMLKANETVAKYLSDTGKPLIFRIHEEPSVDSKEDFFAIARSLGFALPHKPTQKDLQKLFTEARKTRFSQQLAVSFIRSLKLAYYSPANVGHFGLALDHYCHFTSPIRRYSDLVTQRILFDGEQTEKELTQIAMKCSEKERISFRAETSVKILKKLRLLKRWHKNDPKRVFYATITRIKPYGIHFEIKDLLLEGFLHVSELEDDFFRYEPSVPLLKGQYTGKRHQIGEEIDVILLEIDLIHLDAKWKLSSKFSLKKKTISKKNTGSP